MNILINGGKQDMQYDEICKKLGFSANCEFVKVTSRGTIGFSAGKPEEIQALANAVDAAGMKPSAKLQSSTRRA